MSVLAYPQAGTSREDLQRVWQERLRDAQTDRERYHPNWFQCLAFSSGKHHLEWDYHSRQLVEPQELYDRDVYSIDTIGEFRSLALGELSQDDDRPQLLVRQDDDEGKLIQQMLNQAVGFAWEHEWEADFALSEARRYCVDLGTAAIRCSFDPTAGPVRQADVPFQNGRPMLDPAQARKYVADQQALGESANLRSIHEGRTHFAPLSVFNLLVPPGIHHERFFPWECVVTATPLDDLIERFPAAKDLREDTDIGSVFGYEAQAAVEGVQSRAGDPARSKLRDHGWLFTVYERPCRKYPKGQVIYLAGGLMKLLEVEDELPYVAPSKEHTSGIAYMHWDRVTGRFWSRGLVEKLKDPARMIDRRRTQQIEIGDRDMPKIFVEEGTLTQRPEGLPMEFVELRPGAPTPDHYQGHGPGEWMSKDVEEFRLDAEHASGIRAVKLGENPSGVTTYSQLAQLNENDQVKRENIYREQRLAVARLLEAGVYDIDRYWPEEKTILLAGDEGQLEEATFRKSVMKDRFFVVEVARGSAKPRNQAAQLKLTEDLWQAANESGVVMMNPPAWLQWYKDSLDAGKPLDLPSEGQNVHVEKAEFENTILMDGELPPVDDFDPHEVHIPIHRAQQIEAELSGNVPAFQAFKAHIDEHVAVGAAVAQQIAAMAGPALAPEPEPAEPTRPGESA